MKVGAYIIRADEPFRGIASILLDDGTVGYDGRPFEEYQADHSHPLKLVSEEELDALIDAYHNSMITEPRKETEEQWFFALEVLPPCRWHSANGFEFFHISERQTANLVNWHVRCGDAHFTFIDRDNLTTEQLVNKMVAALSS